MTDPESDAQNMEDLPRVGGAKGLRFGCHPGVPCFNACCHDLDLVLNPYDWLVLRQALELSSTELMERHGQPGELGDTGFPIVRLAMKDAPERPCPFVGPEGCAVYASRPAACRAYPIARGAGLGAKGELLVQFRLVKEDHCRGFEERQGWTVREWLADQGVPEHTAVDDRYVRLVSRHLSERGPLPEERRLLVALALYQVDRLPELWERQPAALTDLKLSPEREAAIRADEKERLLFAFDWLDLALLGDDTALRGGN